MLNRFPENLANAFPITKQSIQDLMPDDHDLAGTTTEQREKTVLLVIGMHRSGTSATSGALQCLGAQLGKRLYAGHEEINAKGYFEHSDIVDANEEALLAIGSCWDDVLPRKERWWDNELLLPYARTIERLIRRDFANSGIWALKDPRICRLLPWWLHMLEAGGAKARLLFVLRSPDAVTRSLKKRDGFSEDKSALLWLLHYLEAERWSRGHPRVFIEFDRLLDAPVEQLARAERELGVTFPIRPADAASCLNTFLTADLRHHVTELKTGHSGRIEELAGELFRILQQKALQGDGVVEDAELDVVWHRLQSIQDACPAHLIEHLNSVAERHGQATLLVGRVTRSWSWYIGKPIRFFERLIGRDV